MPKGRWCSTASRPTFRKRACGFVWPWALRIPVGIELNEFPPLLLDQVPRLRHYRFVVAQDQLVIVAPQERSIALVLDR
jgi:hypothetical protein